jgi:hypothetical protein
MESPGGSPLEEVLWRGSPEWCLLERIPWKFTAGVQLEVSPGGGLVEAFPGMGPLQRIS